MMRLIQGTLMGAVNIYNREQPSFAENLPRRGHHVVYRTEEANRCPGCGRSNWHVGRLTAECAFCGAAIALAEADWGARGRAARAAAASTESVDRINPAGPSRSGANRRRHERLPVKDRTLQMLIEGSPRSFAIRNLSTGGLMGDALAPLEAGARDQVRFEGGILVPATVRWSADGLVGLAFEQPVIFDTARAD
jgi:hypothetical protein